MKSIGDFEKQDLIGQKVFLLKKIQKKFLVLFPSRAEQYDTYEIIKRLVDQSNSKNTNQIMAKLSFVLQQELMVGL